MKRVASLVALLVAFSALAPGGAAAAGKFVNTDGSVPAQFDLAKPDVVRHPDTAPSTAGGNGDGSNTLSFSLFEDGDFCVVLGTATGHAGEWDAAYDRNSLNDYCIWSANVSPRNGVQREQPAKYRAYDVAFGGWVPSVSAAKRAAARAYCRAQNGEPYDIVSAKSDTARWYCSKLVWSSYRAAAGIDLDADSGYWVWPVDLVNDSQTAIFAAAN